MSNIITFPRRNHIRQQLLLRDPIRRLEADVFYLCMQLEQSMLKLQVIRDNLIHLEKDYY
jgi:hypothetical protein